MDFYLNGKTALITQRSRVQIPPPLPVSAGQGLIARTAVRPFDHPLAVRWRDLACEHGTSRPGPAGIGTAARSRPPRGRLTGTGGGMLLAARATPSRAGSTVVIPGRPSGSEPDDRRWGQPGFGHRARHGGQAWQGRGRWCPPVGWLLPGGAHHLAGHQMRQDCCRPCRRVCWARHAQCGRGRAAIAERPRSTGMHALEPPRRIGRGSWPGRPCHARTDLWATGRSVSTDRHPILVDMQVIVRSFGA